MSMYTLSETDSDYIRQASNEVLNLPYLGCSMNVHEGHRERLRKRYLEQGLNGFNDLNALELLLFHAIPRIDTNPIAHALLDRFGSLAAVFEASVQELKEVPGIGENAAVLITLIPQMMRKAMVSKNADVKIISDAELAGQFFLPKFMFETDEVVLLACLDARKRVISCAEMNRGVVNSVAISARKIVETALLNKADSVIIAHNHPQGFALPSREDKMITTQIRQSLATIGVELVDHIIVADGEFVSMAQSNFFLR